MRKRLIVTRADEKVKEYTKVTHPVIRAYAEKVNADFKVIRQAKDLHPHYRILQIYDRFEKYEQILVLDSDLLILKS